MAFGVFFAALAGCGGGSSGSKGSSGVNAGVSAFCDQGGTGTAVLTWVPPTMTVDGSPVALKEFKIYCGDTDGRLELARIVTALDTTAVFSNLPNGTTYFLVTAVSVTGAEESSPSNFVSKSFP